MDKGTCWQCRYLSVKKDIDEVFWHYTCRRFPSKGEMDPSKMIYYERCFESKRTNFKTLRKAHLEKRFDADNFIKEVLDDCKRMRGVKPL